MPARSSINRETVPPGLLMVADLAARIPERKDELIAYELKRREREIALIREARQQASWHPWQTVKSVALYGLNGFILAWAAGLLASLGQSYSALKSAQISLPFPLSGGFNVGSLVPTSTTLLIASYLPSFSFSDALFIGLAVALTVIVMRVIIVTIRWKRIRALREEEGELQKEMEILREWQKTVDERGKNV